MTSTSRRRLLSGTALAGAALLAACNGLTAQQVADNVITMFQTAVTATTAFLSQMGVAVPPTIVALVTKMQTIAANVVSTISAVAASGYVQDALSIFNQIVALATSAAGGNLPGVVVNAVKVVMEAFAWMESALGIGSASARVGAASADPAVILQQLNQIIAAAS